MSVIGDFAAHGHPVAQRDRLEILGTAGTILLADDRLRLIRGERTDERDAAPEENVTIDFATDYDASYLGALTHFLDRLDDGEAFETSAEDNLETLRIVEEIYGIANPRPIFL